MYLELGEGTYLYPGKNYSLGIRFQTNISTELEGFYISSYTNPQGERRSAHKIEALCKFNFLLTKIRLLAFISLKFPKKSHHINVTGT